MQGRLRHPSARNIPLKLRNLIDVVDYILRLTEKNHLLHQVPDSTWILGEYCTHAAAPLPTGEYRHRKSQEQPGPVEEEIAGRAAVTKALDPAVLKPGDEIVSLRPPCLWRPNTKLELNCFLQNTDQLADGRYLLHKGKLSRKSTGVLGGWTDVMGYIFDNCCEPFHLRGNHDPR